IVKEADVAVSCIDPCKVTHENIIRVKPIPTESCRTLQCCDACNVFADVASGTTSLMISTDGAKAQVQIKAGGAAMELLSPVTGSLGNSETYKSLRALRHPAKMEVTGRLFILAALVASCGAQLMSSVTEGTIDINTDLGCCRATDPDMAFSSIPGSDDTMASLTAQSWDTNMDT
ncbi:hypothetical protein U0070_003079, partial [Myodes glareolus]